MLERTPTHSDTGSHTGSYTGSFGGASTIIAKHALYELEMTAETDITVEYGKLMKSYQELLRLSSKTDTRLSQFVGVVETLLPGGIDRASADEDGVTSLQTAFRQLSQMYRTLRKSYDGATGKTTVLETTVSELQAIIATLPPRPTEPMGTEMSPPRLAAFKAAAVEESDVVVGLRARVTELEAAAAEKDRLATENATALETATAERDRLAAENAKLTAAAAKPAATSTTKGASKGVREPLLGGNYTQLDDGASASKGKKGSNKEEGCPSCTMM